MNIILEHGHHSPGGQYKVARMDMQSDFQLFKRIIDTEYTQDYDINAMEDSDIEELALSCLIGGQNEILLLMEYDEIIGYVNLGHKDGNLHIDKIFIDENHRGKRLSNILYEACFMLALFDPDYADCTYIEALIAEDNVPSIRAAEGQGFEIIFDDNQDTPIGALIDFETYRIPLATLRQELAHMQNELDAPLTAPGL